MQKLSSESSVSFFNEVAAEMQNYPRMVSFLNELEIPFSKTSVSFLKRLPQRRKNYPRMVSFFNELEIRKPCLKTSVSFFNEVASETKKKKNYPPLFQMRLPQRRKNYPHLCLIMDSKRTMLWNDTMSRDQIWSWLPRGLHWKEETHSGRTPSRGSRQE
jgi:hypothetical protein